MNKETQAKIQNISFQMFRDWTANAKSALLPSGLMGKAEVLFVN